MAILLQQDFSQPNDEKGMRDSIKPQHIRSGTYFNQMQLRGSILVIKDNLNTESGYLAFGSDMSTIPTSPTTGTGVYIDYRGIYGNSSGTQQFYLQSSDGKAYAGAGAVVLDADGITISQGNNDNNIVKWTNSGTDFFAIGGSYGDVTTDILTASYSITTAVTNSQSSHRMTVYTGSNEPDINLYLNVNGSTASSPTYGAASDAWARLWSADGTFLGLLIGEGSNGDDYQPQSLLHLHSTAPTFRMEDTTASAKSLLVTVNANRASIKEVAGSEILGLELASEAVTHNTYAITKTIQKTGIADNTATGVFTVTTTNETGNVDGGAFVCDVLAIVTHIATSGAGNNAVKKYRGSFSREIISTAAGVNTAVEDTFSGTSAASDAATRDIGTITMSVTETSEYVQTVNFTVDLSGSSVQTAEVTVFITLLWTGFTTPPTIAAV
jgi:hypothetical protein